MLLRRSPWTNGRSPSHRSASKMERQSKRIRRPCRACLDAIAQAALGETAPRRAKRERLAGRWRHLCLIWAVVACCASCRVGVRIAGSEEAFVRLRRRTIVAARICRIGRIGLARLGHGLAIPDPFADGFEGHRSVVRPRRSSFARDDQWRRRRLGGRCRRRYLRFVRSLWPSWPPSARPRAGVPQRVRGQPGRSIDGSAR
jgi:hypothetical protein